MEENTDGFGFELADERGKGVAAAESGVAAAVGINAAEGIRAFPGGVEGADAPAGTATDAAVVTVLRQVQVMGLGHEGEQLLKKEPHVGVAE